MEGWDNAEPSIEPDSDGDGNPDYLDIDSDNDGILIVEGGDGDFKNGDGVLIVQILHVQILMETVWQIIQNPPQSPIRMGMDADFLDIDSDNDGIFDVVEGGDSQFDTVVMI